MERKKLILPPDASGYWTDRILEAEAKAQRTAGIYAKKELAYYKDALKKINEGVNALYAQLQSDGIESISRSQLWQYKRWQELRGEIYNEARALGNNQISLLDTCIDEVFKQNIGEDINTFNSISNIARNFTKTYLNENWSGMHYSQRVWGNTGKLAASLEKKVADLVVLGKTPDEVKKEIMDEFGASFHQADRLIRTETSYAFNQSALNRYAEMGASKVEFYAEPDCCDQCAEYSGQQFNLNDAPMIPLHPNCRCTYLPII